MIKNKDIVVLNLILKDNDSKDLLDTTLPEIAKENNLNIKAEYKPLTYIFGTGELLKGVEENIKNLKEEESKTFVLKKEQAFGDRDQKKIEVLHLSDFKNEKINPEPGLYINIGHRSGKIISVSGGRVKVDFNPIFAGRDLEYTVIINKIISKDDEKISPLLNKVFHFIPQNQMKYIINSNSKEVEIQLPLGIPKEVDYLKQVLAKMIIDTTTYDVVKYCQNFYRNEKKGE